MTQKKNSNYFRQMAKIRHKKITNFCYITKLGKKKHRHFRKHLTEDALLILSPNLVHTKHLAEDALLMLSSTLSTGGAVLLLLSSTLSSPSILRSSRTTRESEREEGCGGEERTTPCRKGRWELKQKILPNKKLQFSSELGMASMALMCVIARVMYHCLERLADFVLEFY